MLLIEKLSMRSKACDIKRREFHIYLRNRKHFPCFYRVIETRVEVLEKREIAWEHEHEVRVFPRNFEFLPNFHKFAIKKNLLILITFIQILILIYTFV